jgi:hypothetical protein
MAYSIEIVREQLKKAFSCCLNPKIVYEDDDSIKVRIEDSFIIFKQLVLLMSVSECNLMFVGVTPIKNEDEHYCLIVYQKKGFFRGHFIRRIYEKK